MSILGQCLACTPVSNSEERDASDPLTPAERLGVSIRRVAEPHHLGYLAQFLVPLLVEQMAGRASDAQLAPVAVIR